jgi:hypothetical protein
VARPDKAVTQIYSLNPEQSIQVHMPSHLPYINDIYTRITKWLHRGDQLLEALYRQIMPVVTHISTKYASKSIITRSRG